MSIVTTHPEIAKQWHPTKNGDLKPENFTSGIGRYIWWRCDKTCKYGCVHEWETKLTNRTNSKSGCPFCVSFTERFCIHESILYTHPQVARQWHPTLNGDLKPENFKK